MRSNKAFLGFLLVPAFVLLVPYVAMRFTDEVNWTTSDFVVAWVLMAGAGLAYQFATRQAGNVAYRAAAGVAVATGFLLIWINLAVGFIGSEDNPANLMYGGVLAVGITGALLARFQPQGMARALFATALVQGLVPVIALTIWRPQMNAEVLKECVLNACFVMLFVTSAFLFRRAAGHPDGSGPEVLG